MCAIAHGVSTTLHTRIKFCPSTTLTRSINVTYQQPKQLKGTGPGKNKDLLHTHDSRINRSASCEFSQYSSQEDTVPYSKLLFPDLFLICASLRYLQHLHFSDVGIRGQ